jgi:membrane dipeptidase
VTVRTGYNPRRMSDRLKGSRKGLTPVLAVSLLAPGLALSALAEDLDGRAKRVHRAAIVVDTHVDAPYALEKKSGDLAVRGATPHFDIPRAREGGLTAPFFAVYVPARYAETGGAALKTLELIDLVRRVVAEHPGDLTLADSVAGIRRAKKEGSIAVLMGIEGGHAIEDSLGALRQFYGLGVRYMTLTHTNTNHWADSSGRFYAPDFNPAEARVHGGLSDFGRGVVREMNRLGMMVDVSHVSDETIDDVLETSRAPVFASHSSCRALADIPRNLTDDQIRRIAAKGGVVMINVSSYFVDQEVVEAMRAARLAIKPEYERIKTMHAGDPKARDAALEKLLDTIPRQRTSWTHVVDHIVHVLGIAGPEAVGLGTDFDGIQDPPEGLEDVSTLPKITLELLRRGHSEAVVRKVLGENFLRFFERVEGVARTLSTEPASTASLE